jgi:hypothetical protein
LGPLGTAATNKPIVPAPGDYGDGEIGGMMIGRENQSTRRKPTPVQLCLPQIPHILVQQENRNCHKLANDNLPHRTEKYPSSGFMLNSVTERRTD